MKITYVLIVFIEIMSTRKSKQVMSACCMLSAILAMVCHTASAFGQLPGNIRQQIEKGNHATAVDLLTKELVSTKDERLYYWRGRENFRCGNIKESLVDFDRFYERFSNLRSRQWERGIACYYAGEFQKGSDQFRLYQTYHGNDVENAVWKALCDARMEGFQKAAKQILPIRNDQRVPMMEIYGMFRGTTTPAHVVAVAEQAAKEKKSDAPLFYAHLYVALFYEINHQPKLVIQHLERAKRYKIDHYMWDVARVHLDRLKQVQKEENDSINSTASSRESDESLP